MNSNSENKDYGRTFEAVFFAGLVLNICFAFPLLGHSSKKDLSQSIAEIDNRLNPNTASVYELAELPGLGSAKAQAIVEYRENIKKAFGSADDLDNIKGFGKKTVDKIKKWLVFDENKD